jgi:predicted RNA-binding protein associated with RNAse of E/G family
VTWPAGEVIVVQEVWRDRLWAARPVVVVDDRPDELVLWCPQGTVRKVPVPPYPWAEPDLSRGGRMAECLASGEWILEDSVWDVSTLWLQRDEDWHAIWVSFLENGEQWGWYVNFQEPTRRTARGVRTMDLALDIIVEPDRSSWRWKDEDEFDLYLARGVFSPEVGGRVREEASGVIERIGRNDPPFDSEWPHWKPDPAWGIPLLPDGWDVLA